jgi:hypothetical protein
MSGDALMERNVQTTIVAIPNNAIDMASGCFVLPPADARYFSLVSLPIFDPKNGLRLRWCSRATSLYHLSEEPMAIYKRKVIA